MGGRNKLLEPVGDRPMLAHVVDAVQRSRADLAIVVVGYEGERVSRLLRGRSVDIVTNPDYARGLSASLACGVGALPASCDAVIVCLGDMPRIRAAHLNRLIRAFEDGCEICVPVHAGRRGNPVLWARRFFAELGGIRGDTGARALLERHARRVCEVPMADDAVLFDVDTPDALGDVPLGGSE